MQTTNTTSYAEQDNTVGERIEQVRKMRGYKASELELKARLTGKLLHGYEVGKVLPSIPSIRKIAKVLNVSVDYLLGLRDDFCPLVESSELALVEEGGQHATQ